jgi:hypothetical protein
MKSVAIVQSNYIPWRGYFDMIASVDEFILYDDVQYTRRDWRNRNKIKTPTGLQWLTTPVKSKGNYLSKICEIEIDGMGWRDRHWSALTQNYSKARNSAEIFDFLHELYFKNEFKSLSFLNKTFIESISHYLDFKTKISTSSQYKLIDGKSERLADLCLQAGASTYVSGPAARSYLDSDPFTARGIDVRWFDYSGLPSYPQLWGGFESGVSVLDLLFNTGREASQYLPHFRGN